jgi:hypothetical protein
MTAKAASTKKTKTAKPKAVAAKVTAKAKTTEQPKGPVKDDKSVLRKWHLYLGGVLVAEAAAVVVAGASKTVELTTQYLSKDALATEAAGGSEVLATATRHLADVPLSWMVAAFLVVFGASFLLLATVWRKYYEAWLERGVNKARWVAYGVGTGLMAVTVAMLSGITDLGYLILIFASLAALGSISTIVELIGPGRHLRKYVIITALGAAALPVVAIGLTLKGVLLYGGSLPMYVYFVYASMFLAVVAFALGCILRLRRRGRWMDTFYTERAFMLLGFGAATVLALQIFAGALQP